MSAGEWMVLDGAVHRRAAAEHVCEEAGCESVVVIETSRLLWDEEFIEAVARRDFKLHGGTGSRFDEDWITQTEQVLAALHEVLEEREKESAR